MSKIVIASGYFDPLHVGHIEYLKRAAALGDELIVIVNNNEQTKKKKGYVFMSQEDRLLIVSELRCVTVASIAIDKDPTVCKSLKALRCCKPKDELIFAKGGDRKAYEIPERQVCKRYGIKIVDGLGDKIRSSSQLVKEAKNE